MFARHNFVYKRSQNGPHHNIAARALLPSQLDSSGSGNGNGNGNGNSKTPSVVSLASSLDNPTTSTPATTPVVTSQTPNTPTPSLQDTPSSSTPALAPTSSSSSSNLKLTSSSSPSSASSAVHSPSSTVSTAPIVAPTTHAVSVLSQTATGLSFTHTSTSSPSSTASPSSSSGTNTASIVGGIAGTLAGIAVLGFLLMWCMRRQRNRDLDDFDAQAFKRQSVMLVDDPVEPPQSYNPRPPTMIERHNASPALAAQGGYGGQNFYGNYGGGQQSSYTSPEVVQSGSPPQAYGAPAMGYSGYNDQQPIARQPSNVGYAAHDSQQLVRQPSNAQYLTRQPSSAVAFSPPAAPSSSFDPNAHYIDLDRSSISPYQAAQYADISRQLGTSNPNGQAPPGSHDLPADPLPSPFDDPVEVAESTAVPHTIPDRPSEPTVASPAVVYAAAPQPQGRAPEPHQRPATVYDEGDAYGGI